MSFPNTNTPFISLQQLVQRHPDHLSVDGVGHPFQFLNFYLVIFQANLSQNFS